MQLSNKDMARAGYSHLGLWQGHKYTTLKGMHSKMLESNM